MDNLVADNSSDYGTDRAAKKQKEPRSALIKQVPTKNQEEIQSHRFLPDFYLIITFYIEELNFFYLARLPFMLLFNAVIRTADTARHNTLSA